MSTVAVEQQFSVDGNILVATRSSINSYSIKAQARLDDGMKAQYRQQKIDQEPMYEFFENNQITGTEGSDD